MAEVRRYIWGRSVQDARPSGLNDEVIKVTDPDAGTVAGEYRELTRERCEELLGSTSVGRIAFCRPDGAHILPVNYRYGGSVLVIRTSPYGSLAVLAPGVDGVAFEVDHHNDLLQTAWSVVVRGRVAAIEDPGSELAAEARPRPWAAGTRALFLRLTPDSITGRGVRRR